MGHIDATWVGPYGYTLADGTALETGITVVSVPEGEALASDYWLPVQPLGNGNNDDEDE